MGTSGELNDAFATAYNRIVGAVGKEAFQMQVLGKFPLVLTTQSVKDIASGFGFDESLLIPPANKRTRAQQAIANTQHIGLLLRQGPAAQVGAQQQHGLAPEVSPIPAVPVPPTPVPAQVAVPVTPGNGQQVMYEVQSEPQTPVPMRRRRRMPPGPPLALTFEAAAPGTPNPVAIGIPAVPGTPLVSAAAMPAPAASTPANAGPLASAQDSIAPAASDAGASGPDAGASGPDAGASGPDAGASGRPDAGATDPNAGASGLAVAASTLAPGVIGDSSAAEPPAANVQVQGENREVENEHRLLCVICQSYMDSSQDGQALEALPCGHSFHSDCLRESGVEWPRLGIFTSAHCIPSPGLSGANLQLQMTGSLIPVPIDEEDVPAPLAVVPALGPELL